MRLGAGEARRRFSAAPVARLATAGRDGRPHIVPVTFALDGDVLYTAVDAKPKTTSRLRRLANIAENPAVALLADHYTGDWQELWWVRADGHATICEPDGIDQPLRLLAGRYPQYRASPPAGPVIRIQVERWIGWAAAPGGEEST
jgi:PPOX class probable F420-dependent enzyme